MGATLRVRLFAVSLLVASKFYLPSGVVIPITVKGIINPCVARISFLQKVPMVQCSFDLYSPTKTTRHKALS